MTYVCTHAAGQPVAPDAPSAARASRSSFLGRLAPRRLLKTVALVAGLLGSATAAHAQDAGIFNGFAILSINGGANAYYDLAPNTGNPDLDGAALGSFNPGSGNTLVLRGGELQTFKNGGADVSSARLNYRVYLSGAPSGAYTAVNLPFGSNLGPPGDQKWEATANTTNLLAGLPAGNYVLDVYGDATTTVGGKFMSNGGLNYKATFTVSSPASSFTAGFETGLDGFTLANTVLPSPPGLTATNTWVRGTVAGGAAASANSLYITDNGGAAYNYTQSTLAQSRVHAYRDIVVPAGETAIGLLFDWKNVGENNYDYLRVSYAPTTFVPTVVTGSGARLASGTTITGTGGGAATILVDNRNGSATYQTESAVLPASLAGTTVRLIFTWFNDGSLGGPQPASFDNVRFTSAAPVPLTGTYTINNTLGTGGRNFQSFTDAVHALNLNGVSGAVTFNATAGQTFTENVPVITATGTLANPITFQTSPAGTNAVLRPTGLTGAAGAADAGFVINGGDYFAFDGIDVNIASGSDLEYGYVVRNGSATNGALNNTIRNAAITLNRTNTASVGVLQSNTTTFGGGSATASNVSGTNQNNTYHNLTIRNAAGGIMLYGTSTTYFDNNTQVYANAIGDPGTAGDLGGTGVGYGLRAFNQQRLTVRDNTVRNVRTTSTSSAVYGLWLEQLVGTGANASNIYNNRINGVATTAPTNSANVTGIDATVPSGTHTINLYNNVVQDLSSAYSTASTIPRVMGIMAQPFANSSTTASEINVSFNTVRIALGPGAVASSTAYRSGVVSGTKINLRNNNFTNFTGAQTGSSRHYAVYSSSDIRLGNTGSTSDYNNFYVDNTTNGFLVQGNTTNYTALTGAGSWNAASSQDANSVSVNPAFDGVLKPLAIALDDKGTPFGGITTDIAGTTRSGTTPDIGAYEFVAPVIGDITVTTLVSPVSTGCVGGLNQTVTVRIQNVGAAAIDLTATPVTVTGAVMGANPATFTSVVLNTGTLAINATQDVVLSTTYDMTAAGTYTFNSSASFTGDPNVANNTLSSGNIREVIAPLALPLTPVTFTGFTGANLSTVFPGWTEATGATLPVTAPSSWTSSTFPVGNATAKVNLFSASRREWIVGPKFAGAANSRLTFRAGLTSVGSTGGAPSAAGMGSDDVLQVMVSTDCGTTYAPIYTFNNATQPSNGALTYYVVDLSAYAGQDVVIAFFASDGLVDDVNDYDVHIDDIIIENTPANDVGLTAFVAPGATGCYSATEDIVVRIKNYGTAAQVNIPVTVNVTGAVVQTLSSSYAGPLAPGASFDYTVGQVDMTIGGTYTFTATTALVGDGAASNDALNGTTTRTTPATATLPQRLNFTGFTGSNLTALYPAWREAQTVSTSVPSGTTSGWSNGTFGSTTAKINLFSNTKRDWIVGPKVNATATTKLTFQAGITEYASTSGAPDPDGMTGTDDAVQVMISTDCGATYTPALTFNSANQPSNGSLSTYSVDLSSYAGQGIIVAFFATEGTINDDPDYDFHLDNVVLRNEPAVDIAPVALAAPLNGATCLTATEPVTVTVQNTGTATLDFAANPLTLNVNVTGAAVAALTGSLNTGTLVAGATTTVTTSATLDMSAIGTYTFAITATVTGDGDTGNDVLDPVAITKTAPTIGTLSSSLGNFCGGTQSTTLAVTAFSNGTVEYQQSPNGVNNWTTVVGVTGSPAVVSGITATTYYRARTVCGATQSALTNVVQVTNVQPTQVVSAPTTACVGTAYNLAVISSGGTTAPSGSAAPNAAIPDNNTTGVSSTITLAGAGAATVTTSSVVTVTLNIAHTFVGDLDIFLVDPSGTRAMLLTSDNGGGGENFTNTVLQTGAATNITTIVAVGEPYTATYAPEGGISTAPDRTGAAASGNYNAIIPASAIVGAAINGAWTLRVFDDAGGDAGTLLNWSLAISEPTLAPYTFAITGPGTVSAVTYTVNGTNGTVTVTDAPVGGNLYTITTTDLAGCTATTTHTVTVANTTTWTGASNTNWFDGSNWTTCVPTVDISAIIPTTTVKPVIGVGTALVKDLDIQGTGTLTVNGSGNLSVYGTFTVAGPSSFVATAGTTSFVGTGAQPIPAGAYHAVTVSGATPKVLTGAATLGGGLNISGGMVLLGAFDLTLANNQTITGADDAHFLVTNGAGKLAFEGVGGGETVVFPIGTSTAATDYTPATLTNNGTADTFAGTVSNADPVRAGPTPPFAPGEHVVRKTWDISEAVAGGSNAALTLVWNEANEGPLFDRTSCTISHFTGSIWEHYLRDFAAATNVGGTRWARTRINGLTSFSPFAVQDNFQPLPVELARFDAVRNGQNADLTWATASEKNNKGFEVQVSTNGGEFRKLAFIDSRNPTSQTAQTYAFTDRETGKTGVRYYRLKQVDLDGTATFSPVRTLTFSGSVTTKVNALPNPFGQEQLRIELDAAANGTAQLVLIDALGRVVLNQAVTVTVGHNEVRPALPATLSVGTYTLVATVDGQQFRTRLVKQ